LYSLEEWGSRFFVNCLLRVPPWCEKWRSCWCEVDHITFSFLTSVSLHQFLCLPSSLLLYQVFSNYKNVYIVCEFLSLLRSCWGKNLCKRAMHSTSIRPVHVQILKRLHFVEWQNEYCIWPTHSPFYFTQNTTWLMDRHLLWTV
jgi:hypothetical protein